MPDRRLSRIITLEDGTKLRTIDDAAKAIERLYPPSLQWDPLTHAMRLLATAAETGNPKDMDAATDQLAMVLAISPQTKSPARRKPKRGV
jgi:hypothetical protein